VSELMEKTCRHVTLVRDHCLCAAMSVLELPLTPLLGRPMRDRRLLRRNLTELRICNTPQSGT
jgi:hypothetical protein